MPTAIEWTDETWNPIRQRRPGHRSGHYCLKLSPGCDNCYAGRQQPVRFHGRDYEPATAATIATARDLVAAGEIFLDPKTLEQPLSWRRPRRVFVCSMTDLFGEWVPTSWIDNINAVMAAARYHTFQVLTKRPHQMADYLSDPDAPRRINLEMNALSDFHRRPRIDLLGLVDEAWPLPNAWLGVSVELDRFAWRAKALAEIPAAVRFVSAEPLLGPLPSLELKCRDCLGTGRGDVLDPDARCGSCNGSGRAIDWLIVGGESGGPADRRLVHKVRHHVDREDVWSPTSEAFRAVRDLRERAQATGVAFFFKQWGGPTPKSGGRLLDGKEWSEYPSAQELPA
ncbi:MAG: DUF5131 family protein [Acidimicrobiales bacterium]